MKWTERLRNGWNAFKSNDEHPRDQTTYDPEIITYGSSRRPDRPYRRLSNERSIINAIYTRIAVDASQIDIRHVYLDQNGRFAAYVGDSLDRCLSLEANIDQTGRQLMQDAVMSMMDEGVVAVIPVDTTIDPKNTDAYEIKSLRTGKVLEWYPASVRVDAYDERVGLHKQIFVGKTDTAIIENPFFSVMNERNSTLQRLIRKLNLIDMLDEQNSSGKLDMIIQLPYAIKHDSQKAQAEQRRKDIEVQLVGSKYGIAYIDATEKITQLNRSIDNNLMTQVEYHTKMLYSQLGLTEEIMNGTADEQAMLNYYSRTIEPFIKAICLEFKRKFLSQTAISQGQSIESFRNPFNLVPINNIADIADKFTRNAILSSNEIRGIIGFKPVNDPQADELRNKNLNKSDAELQGIDRAPNTQDEVYPENYV